MKTPLSVLLTTEGTYPFFEGGVSTWCDVLIRELSDVQFTLMSLTAQPGLRPAYQLPSNVVRHLPTPLWGTGGVNELRREVGWRELQQMRSRSLLRTATQSFSEAFESFLIGLLDDRSDIKLLGHGLQQLALFFTTHDYDATFRAPTAWSIFQEQVTRLLGAKDRARPTLLELAEALRLLYRWLTPIALPMPRVDVVHASAAGLAALPGIVARLAYGTPLLLTEHGVYLRERLLAWANTDCSPFVKLFAIRVIRRLVELSYDAADIISPVCSWNARWQLRLGAVPERIKPISNGVDTQRFAPQPMPDAHTPTLVWVGRIDPLKDLLTLIDAVDLIRQQIPNVKVLLFGKAPVGNEAYEAACRSRRKELGLETTLQFMGFAKSPQDAYAQGHVVVLSSISEALPFSIIEAMCCGRPVVGTGVGGVPEVIGETGRVVAPRDPEHLAAACIELLGDAKLSAMLGERARERALEHYTLRHLIEAYHDTYQVLASEMRTVPVVPFARTETKKSVGLMARLLTNSRQGREVYEPRLG